MSKFNRFLLNLPCGLNCWEYYTELVKIFHRIVYQGNRDGHWKNVLSVFDQMNAGISDRMKQLFPNFKETEYKVALLTYAGMSVKDISMILGLSSNTIQTYRTGLRKKMGIEDLTIETAVYIKDLLENE